MNAPLRTQSGFARKAHDAYDTPPEAVAPLVRFLSGHASYVEPCAGAGRLIEGLALHAPWLRCVCASDLHPRAEGIFAEDAASLTVPLHANVVITNPPWPHPGKSGDPAVSIILNLCRQRTTWALLPFSFAANRYFARVSAHCFTVAPIGRVSWEGNGVPGTKDAAWFGFWPQTFGPTRLAPRET